MSEWIRREDREPPKDVGILKVDTTERNPEVWAGRSDSSGLFFTHWMPLPDPPARMLTIEISEEDARDFKEFCRIGEYCSMAVAGRIASACAKALEEKR